MDWVEIIWSMFAATCLTLAIVQGLVWWWHRQVRASNQGWNEIVVYGRGNAYVNGGPGIIALIKADLSARQVADGIAFLNGMAVTPDNTTLIIAESHGKRLTAFDIGADGSLWNRRVWADPGDGVPDGICLDAEGCVWYADVPNKRCVRVREGGEVIQTINLDRGCFALHAGWFKQENLVHDSDGVAWHG
jgi:sugar lactone lactonase YvrE